MINNDLMGGNMGSQKMVKQRPAPLIEQNMSAQMINQGAHKRNMSNVIAKSSNIVGIGSPVN